MTDLIKLSAQLKEAKCSEKEAFKIVNRIKMIEPVDKDNLTRLAVNYSIQEQQKILEEAEKGNFLVFQKAILDPKQTVLRSIYPKEKVVLIKFTGVNDHDIKNTARGSWLLTKLSSGWKLYRKDSEKLQEIEISSMSGLQAALDKLPKKYTDDELQTVRKILPSCPIGTEHRALEKEEEFFNLSPTQVTIARNSSPNRSPDQRNVLVGIDLMWVDRVQADEFLGKTNKLAGCPYEISLLSDNAAKTKKESITTSRSFSRREQYIQTRSKEIYREIKEKYPAIYKNATRDHISMLLQNEEKELYQQLNKPLPALASYIKFIKSP